MAASAQQSEAPALVPGAVAAPVEQGGEPAPARPRSSPWLLVPLVSSNPKLGTSFGALGGYLHVFDPGSREDDLVLETLGVEGFGHHE